MRELSTFEIPYVTGGAGENFIVGSIIVGGIVGGIGSTLAAMYATSNSDPFVQYYTVSNSWKMGAGMGAFGGFGFGVACIEGVGSALTAMLFAPLFLLVMAQGG